MFVKAGAVKSDTNVFAADSTSRESMDKSRTSAMFGIGATYAFTSKISALVEFADFGTVFEEDGSKLKVTHVSVGLRFSF